MSERVRAGSMQQPPPDEAEPKAEPTNETEKTAIRVASAYKRSRDARAVQVNAHSVRHSFGTNQLNKVHWEIARYLIQRYVRNIEGYITCQFKYSVSDPRAEHTIGKEPYVKTFTSDKAYDRWLVYAQRAIPDLKQSLDTQSLEFECRDTDAELSFPHYDDKKRWNYVLMNNLSKLSPLFRYCVAFDSDLTEAADRHRAAALLQFLTDPMSYVAAWGDVIPVGLKHDASNIILTRL